MRFLSLEIEKKTYLVDIFTTPFPITENYTDIEEAAKQMYWTKLHVWLWPAPDPLCYYDDNGSFAT